MEVLNHYNVTQFLGFIPKVKKDLGSWRIVNVSLSGKTDHDIAYIAESVKKYFHDMDGRIFICNKEELLVLAHTGPQVTSISLKENVTKHLPEFSCIVASSNVSKDGIRTICLRIEDIRAQERKQLNKIRASRKENIIMIADDDQFLRAQVVKVVEKYGTIVELDEGSAVTDQYLQYVPDVVFLDIHMPGATGLDVLKEITEYDDNSHIIMLSADSREDNVVDTKGLGSKDFIVKPFTREKLEDALEKCPTINMLAMRQATA